MVGEVPSVNRGRRLFVFAAVAAVVLAIFGESMLAWLARKMLFPAPLSPAVSAGDGRSDVTVVELPSGAEAWFLAPQGAREQRAPVLVFTHGNGELIDYWLDDFQVPRAWGMAVLLVEYPGYGRSKGSPSESSITKTMIEAHEYLNARDDIDAARIIAYGRSLGGGAAAALARKKPVRALILESTFSSVRERAREMGFPSFVVADPFDVLSVLKTFAGPILGFHGTEDRIVPYRHAQELQAANENYQLITFKCGHNDCPRPWAEIHSFLQKHTLLPKR